MMKTVTIIGVGALGSHVAQFLRNEATLHVIDFDRVEAKNTLAQFHPKSGLGKNKAIGILNTMNFLWSIKPVAFPRKLEATNVRELIHADSDLVIDCVDNGATRRLIQKHVRDHSLPCLHGALAADGSFGRVIWDEMFQIDDEDAGGAPTCEDGAHLPFIVTVSSLIARSAQVFLKTGKKQGWSIAPTRIEMV